MEKRLKIFPKNITISVLFCALLTIPVSGQFFPVLADTELNLQNCSGVSGAQYWDIVEPGAYYLNVGPVFSTTHKFAIKISGSNIVLDGRGTTITGDGPPSIPHGADMYGVIANDGVSGITSFNVQIRNLKVEKKHRGVIFEGQGNGTIENVNASGNHVGIYLWNGSNNKIINNITNENTHCGVVLDADETVNRSNTIANHAANSNASFGILLWLDCPNTTITGNTVTYNGNTGISISAGSNDCTITDNTVKNNLAGIVIGRESDGSTAVGSHYNEIVNNTLHLNTNTGLGLVSSNKNILKNNQITGNGTGGLWLTSSSSNIITNNVCDSNSGHGIALTSASSNNRLTDNTASYNGEVGILFNSGSNSNIVTEHVANANANGIKIMKSKYNELGNNTLNDNTQNGLSIELSDGNIISNNQIKGTQNSGNAGIVLVSSMNNEIFSNNITHHRWWGIFLNNSRGQTIYNNIFNNPSGNAGFSGSSTNNIWNISKTAGTNIVGGPYKGGNFWGKPDGTGFSQVTGDSDWDGICDTPYTPCTANVDALPLHEYALPNVIYVNQDDPTCGGKTPCFTTIQTAMDFSASGMAIRISQGTYNENVRLRDPKEITVDGGWDTSFETQSDKATVIRPPGTSAGSITFLNLLFKP